MVTVEMAENAEGWLKSAGESMYIYVNSPVQILQ